MTRFHADYRSPSPLVLACYFLPSLGLSCGTTGSMSPAALPLVPLEQDGGENWSKLNKGFSYIANCGPLEVGKKLLSSQQKMHFPTD